MFPAAGRNGWQHSCHFSCVLQKLKVPTRKLPHYISTRISTCIMPLANFCPPQRAKWNSGIAIGGKWLDKHGLRECAAGDVSSRPRYIMQVIELSSDGVRTRAGVGLMTTTSTNFSFEIAQVAALYCFFFTSATTVYR